MRAVDEIFPSISIFRQVATSPRTWLTTLCSDYAYSWKTRPVLMLGALCVGPILLCVWLLKSALTEAAWVTFLSTLVAALSALAASALTGFWYEAADKRKRAQEERALRMALLLEMAWAVDEVGKCTDVRKDAEINEGIFYSRIPSRAIVAGIHVYPRSAHQLGLLGEHWARAAIEIYALLFSFAAKQPISPGVTTIELGEYARLLISIIDMSEEDQVQIAASFNSALAVGITNGKNLLKRIELSGGVISTTREVADLANLASRLVPADSRNQMFTESAMPAFERGGKVYFRWMPPASIHHWQAPPSFI